ALMVKIERTPRSFSALCAQPAPHGSILKEFDYEFRKLLPVALGREKSSVSMGDGFGNSSAGKANDRSSHRLGFQEHHSETFSIAGPRDDAWHAEDLCAVHPGLHDGNRLRSEK